MTVDDIALSQHETLETVHIGHWHADRRDGTLRTFRLFTGLFTGFIRIPRTVGTEAVRVVRPLDGAIIQGGPKKRGHRLITIILSNFYRFKKKFTGRFLGKFTVEWILKMPSHLAYIATLPCETLLSAKQGDINVSQGSVATYTRCGGIFNIHLTANLPRNLPVKNLLNRLRFDRSTAMSLWPRFFGPPSI